MLCGGSGWDRELLTDRAPAPPRPPSAFLFCFWEGLSLSARQRSAPPPPPNCGPTLRTRRPRSLIRAHTTSTHPELVQPPHPIALAAGMPIGATHVATVSTRPTSVRPAAGLCRWLCPLHAATRPLPTQVERMLACQGGPACVPSRPRLPSAAACGISAPRLPPRGFRSDIDPPRLVRPPFRHASEERFEAGPSPPQTDQKPAA
jgi:hypothetical protein